MASGIVAAGVTDVTEVTDETDCVVSMMPRFRLRVVETVVGGGDDGNGSG